MRTLTSGTVSSADQTTIAFDRYGDGSPVIVIGGAYNDRSTVAGVAEALASDNLAAVTYDRRGRGDSTNNDSAFEPERELEDLSAIIEGLGGSVSVFGHSSGAVLALEAAMQRLPIVRVAVYEPPYVVDGTRPLPPDDLDERLSALVRDDRRDDAVRPLLHRGGRPYSRRCRRDARCAGLGLAHLSRTYAALRHGYPSRLQSAHRAPRRARAPTPGSRRQRVVLWIRATAQAVAQAVPGARHLTLEGHDHGVLQHPEALEPVLVEFFS